MHILCWAAFEREGLSPNSLLSTWSFRNVNLKLCVFGELAGRRLRILRNNSFWFSSPVNSSPCCQLKHLQSLCFPPLILLKWETWSYTPPLIVGVNNIAKITKTVIVNRLYISCNVHFDSNSFWTSLKRRFSQCLLQDLQYFCLLLIHMV